VPLRVTEKDDQHTQFYGIVAATPDITHGDDVLVLLHPAVSTIIPGMRKRCDVKANCGVSDGVGGLPTDLLDAFRAHRWGRVPTPWSQ